MRIPSVVDRNRGGHTRAAVVEDAHGQKKTHIVGPIDITEVEIVCQPPITTNATQCRVHDRV